MTVEEIYDAYRIMPGLRLHQLRVATLAKCVCDSLTSPVDTGRVVLAALFHDMGNILKSDFTLFPDLLGSKDVSYWEEVKAEYAEKYGPNVHDATRAIAKEIGLEPSVVALMDSIGFSNMESIRDSDSLEIKVLEYADCRTAPRGVLSLTERLEDARRRYEKKTDMAGEPVFEHERWLELVSAAQIIEEQIFNVSTIRPEDVHDGVIEPLLDSFRTYEVR